MKIPIVNEQDEIVGYKERGSQNPNDIIRATGLWVTDKDDNILLAQRSYSKKYYPGLWGPSAGGTVEENETYESNIIKEAEEEIGLRGVVFTKGPKIRFFDFFSQWFNVLVDKDYNFIKQDEEVEQIKWFSRNELEELFREKPEIFMNGFENYLKLIKINENKD